MKTPAGIPARWASSAKAREVKGVSPGALATMVHPAARAGPILRVTIAAGKFQGVMSPQTPTGSLMVKIRFPGMEAGMVSPSIRGASSENHSRKLAAYATSPFASAKGLPFSQVMSLARSSEFSTINWYHFRRRRDRSRPVALRKVGKAREAAVMADWTSVVEHSGQVLISLPVAGSV